MEAGYPGSVMYMGSVKYEHSTMSDVFREHMSKMKLPEIPDNLFEVLTTVHDDALASRASELLRMDQDHLFPFQRETILRLAAPFGVHAVTKTSRLITFRPGPHPGQCSLLCAPTGTGKTLMATWGAILYTIVHQDRLASLHMRDFAERGGNGLTITSYVDRRYKNIILVMASRHLLSHWAATIGEIPQVGGWKVRVEVLGARSIQDMIVEDREMVFVLAEMDKTIAQTLGSTIVPCVICDEIHLGRSPVMTRNPVMRSGFVPSAVGQYILLTGTPTEDMFPQYKRAHSSWWDLHGSLPAKSSLWEHALGLQSFPRFLPNYSGEYHPIRFQEMVGASVRYMLRSSFDSLGDDMGKALSGFTLHRFYIKIHTGVHDMDATGLYHQLCGRAAFQILMEKAKLKYKIDLPKSFEDGWTPRELQAFIDTCKSPLAKIFLGRLRVEGKQCSICLDPVVKEGIMLSCCLNVMHDKCHLQSIGTSKRCPLCRLPCHGKTDVCISVMDEEAEVEETAKKARVKPAVPSSTDMGALMAYVKEYMEMGSGSCTLRVRMLVFFEALLEYVMATGLSMKMICVGPFGSNGTLVDEILRTYLPMSLGRRLETLLFKPSVDVEPFMKRQEGVLKVLIVQSVALVNSLTGLDLSDVDGIVSIDQCIRGSLSQREARLCRLGRTRSAFVVSFLRSFDTTAPFLHRDDVETEESDSDSETDE